MTITIMFMKRLALTAALCALEAAAQTFDRSATGTVTGDYFVRQVLLANIDQTTSEVKRAVSLTGTMTFDGLGSYSFQGQLTDTRGGTSRAFNAAGSYAVSSSGMIKIQNPIDSSDYEFGGVGRIGPAAIVASATEGANDDIFLAIPAGSSVTNGSLQGTYVGGFIDYLQGSAAQVRDGYFTLAPGGNGNFAAINVTGAMANQGNANTTQKISGATYNILTPDGSGTLNFPAAAAASTSLMSGVKSLFVSKDGNILLAGDPSGFDVMIAIRANSAKVSDGIYQGTYFTAALENNASHVSSGLNNVDSYFGSIFSLGQGNSIQHQRLVFFNVPAVDKTFEGSSYHFDSSGAFNDGLFQTLIAADGGAVVRVGTGSFYSLQPGFQAPQSSGPGVFLDPLKIWNAATYAPITNSVAPGEFVSLFGTGLAAQNTGAVKLPLTTTLGDVQVKVNGRLAPLTFVGLNQVNALIPYATSEPYATFQVFNKGVASNAVTIFTSQTAPGVFAGTFDGKFAPGIGPAAVLHANFSAVTQANPAAIGEVLQLYLTGLGSVTPAVFDGAAGPASPSVVDANVNIFVDGIQAKIQFQGLAPGFAGLYQVNFNVPSGVTAHTLVYVTIQTLGASTSQAKIYIK